MTTSPELNKITTQLQQSVERRDFDLDIITTNTRFINTHTRFKVTHSPDDTNKRRNDIEVKLINIGGSFCLQQQYVTICCYLFRALHCLLKAQTYRDNVKGMTGCARNSSVTVFG